MANTSLIHSGPNVRMGKPAILEKLAAREAEGQIRESHSRLTREAIHAALAFAAEAL